jgi:Peptidase family M1 domain
MRRLVLGLLVFALCPVARAADSSPRDILAALNALRVDDQHVYKLSPDDRIELHEGDIVLALDEGKLAFFQPFEGRITGFVFSGIGHALAIPRNPTEKQQMARFLGAPVLDQQFVSIYARFTNDTVQDLTDQFQHASLTPAPDPAFASLWVSNVERLNPSHSLRILFEKYSSAPRHYFHAGIDGVRTGPFDVLLDPTRSEDFMLGQPRFVDREVFYDVWTSYELPGSTPPQMPFDALHYKINTTIHPDNSIEGESTVEFRSVTGGEAILFVQLSRALKVESVSLPSGEALSFFQNEGLTEQELRTRGDDTLCIFLPSAPPAGNTFALHFRYRGNVIQNYGNSVLYVGARDSWYPHFGDASEFATYDLTFRWPKHLRLVATGQKTGEHDDGDFRVANWKSDSEVAEAGFNLGEYVVASISSSNHVVDVYANKLLEQAIIARLAQSANVPPDGFSRALAERGIPTEAFPPPPPPSPADALRSLAREVDSSITFYEKYCGPFPFHNLEVSQIPGTFGQGWPGLLYLSTYSFLPADVQQRAGLNTTMQESFNDIIPVHEVAHQWWGNVVGWSSYRDQWIDEGLAVYLALLFAESEKNNDRTVVTWLARYRKRLVTKPPDSDLAPGEIGPVSVGSRLSSSKSPDGYDIVVYSKGPWIFHMLREMLREPNSHNPDERFIALLHTLLVKYAQKPLTTEDLQHEVEAVMTHKMDLEGGRSMEWFFQQYVYGTGIPRYRLEFTTRHTEKGFQVRGKLYQAGVPRSFIAPVPLFVSSGSNRSTYLGTVITLGDETSFSFTTPTDPRKILIDPHMTLLCVTE